MAKLLKIIRVSLIILWVAACNQKEEIPAHVIPPDKMAVVLADIHIAEASMEGKRFNLDSTAVYIKKKYHYIFAKHGVEDSVFFRSFQYYEAEPQRMADLYQVVLEELSRREAEVNVKPGVK